MRILIMGNLSSMYLQHFVKGTVLELGMDEIVLFNIGKELSPSAKSVYAECSRQARLCIIAGEREYAQALASGYPVLSRMGYFDVCHLHYIDEYAVQLGKLAGRFCGKILVHYWGSDWLRAGEPMRLQQSGLLRIADYIVSDSREICAQIKTYYNGEFDQRVRFIRFKAPVIEELRRKHVTEDVKSAFMEKYQIPCGYNGNPAHKHLEILKAIEQMDCETRNSLFLLVPATYGATSQYIDELKAELNRINIPSRIILDYLSILEVACLRSVTDIFINVQPTDAYSSTLLEYSYLNKIVVNGSWLDYSDLEKEGAFYEKVDRIADLTEVLERMVPRLEEEKLKYASNTGAADRYQIPYEGNELWEDLYCGKTTLSPSQKQSRAAASAECLLYINELMKSCYMRRMLCIRNLEEQTGLWARKHHFKTVVVYGAGHLGQVVYEQLNGGYLDLLCVADQSVQYVEWCPTNVLSPEEIKDVRPDVVIITPALYFDEIKNSLAAQLDCELLTLDQWTGELADGHSERA